MTRMSPRSLFIGSFALLLTLHAFLAAPAHAQEVPFEGVIAEDDVKVRAGAGRTFYIVGSLAKGTKVTVDEVIFGWHKVVPSTGIHSYISKAFVDAKGDGKAGEVNRDRAQVNAASLDGPGDSYRHQLDLNKGDAVQIVGEEGSFYKIVPPNLGATKRAYVYLPPGSIRREVAVEAPTTPTPATPSTPTTPAAPTTPTAPTAPTTPPTTPTTPVVPPTTPTTPQVLPNIPTTPPTPPTTPAAPPTTPTTPAAPDKPAVDGKIDVPTPASLQKFEATHEAVKQLEGKMSEALKVSIDKQPIDELLAAYTTAATLQGLTAADKYICQVRIAQLTRNQKVQAAVKSAKLDLTPDPKLAEKTADGPDAKRAANYDATGQLMASSVYDGVRLPQLFRVVEPATNRTIVYVRPGAKFDTPKALGRLVGITGKISFDSSMNLRVIEVDRLDVLDIAEPPKAKEAAASTAKVGE